MKKVQINNKKTVQKRTPERRLTKTTFARAIKDSYGNIMVVSERIGCRRSTVYSWLDKEPELKMQLDYEREIIIDLAENKLVENLKNGETSSIHFVLKTLGKKRGYVEKQEIEYSDGLKEKIRKMTREEREKRWEELNREWEKNKKAG
ncbi:hypothetical protein ACFLSS_03025 [Bacteroidota bacterium]